MINDCNCAKCRGEGPQEPKLFCMCTVCGNEIYIGETYYSLYNDTIHKLCLRDWARDFKEVAGK